MEKITNQDAQTAARVNAAFVFPDSKHEAQRDALAAVTSLLMESRGTTRSKCEKCNIQGTIGSKCPKCKGYMM